MAKPVSVTLQPGIANAQDVLLTITTGRGTPVGLQNFNIFAFFFGTLYKTPASVNVVANGVQVFFTGTFPNLSLVVFNSGTVSDTYDLSLAGALGSTATFGSQFVTVAPNQSQTVPITFGSTSFASIGNTIFSGTAISRGNTAVKSTATATVAVPGVKGVSAAITPNQSTAPATLSVQANNTGNLEDTYSAAITAVTGSVTASLRGTDGRATQSIPLFRFILFASAASCRASRSRWRNS